MVINNTILFFIGRILRFVYCVLFIDGNDKHIFQMAEINGCNDRTCFCQVIGILLDFADITDKQSFHVFFVFFLSDNTFSHGYFVILVIELFKTQFSLIDQLQISGNNAIIRSADSHGTDITAIINNGTNGSP